MTAAGNRSQTISGTPITVPATALKCREAEVTAIGIESGNAPSILVFRCHAEPLSELRILWPRVGRGDGAECPRDCPGQWPWPRAVRDRGQTMTGPCPRLIRDRDKAAKLSASWPQLRPQVHHYFGRCPSTTAAYPVAAPSPWPRIVQDRGQSVAVAGPRPGHVRRMSASQPRHVHL